MTQSDTSRVDAIVLAAGRGVRFGGGKLLASLDGAPLVAGALRTAFLSPARRVFVAIADPAVRAAAEAVAARLKASGQLVIVEVEAANEGMGASLRMAAAALPDDTGGAFVFLGDMPAIDPASPALLARALASPHDIVAPTHQGRRGHPVLFGATWLPALRALTGDEGARGLLETARDRLVLLPVDDPGIHLDVDRPADLDRAREGR